MEAASRGGQRPEWPLTWHQARRGARGPVVAALPAAPRPRAGAPAGGAGRRPDLGTRTGTADAPGAPARSLGSLPPSPTAGLRGRQLRDCSQSPGSPVPPPRRCLIRGGSGTPLWHTSGAVPEVPGGLSGGEPAQ